MKNIKLLNLLQFLAFMALMLSIFTSIEVKSAEHIVEMTTHKFVPSKIKVKKDDSIKFVNKSTNFHNVVVEKLKIRTKLIKKDQFLVIKPSQVGVFAYYCQPHRAMGMTGEITVE